MVFAPDEANQHPCGSKGRYKEGHQLLWGAAFLCCDGLKPGTCRQCRTFQVCLHTRNALISHRFCTRLKLIVSLQYEGHSRAANQPTCCTEPSLSG